MIIGHVLSKHGKPIADIIGQWGDLFIVVTNNGTYIQTVEHYTLFGDNN